jgi:phosphoglycerate kinase
MKYLSQQNPELFQHKNVVVRVDFNVPLDDGTVSESEAFRIHAAVPTLTWLKNAGAHIVILSHIGRSGDSLAPVADYIKKHIPELGMTFSQTGAVDSDCVLLENVRKNPGEEANDPAYVQALAHLGDFFVNDAFAVSHRAHASVVGIASLLPSFAGLLMEQEIEHLRGALEPKSPSVLIMAGVKFETKLPLIEKLLPTYDAVILGGGLLNTYLKSSSVSVGNSVIDDTADLSSIIGNEKILIPDQVIVERNGSSEQISIAEIAEGDVIVDMVLSEQMRSKITIAKTVVWNGPLGWYEKGYIASSKELLGLCDPSRQDVIIGGGDTVTLIRQFTMESHASFVSTGGGAMLEYLQNSTLPGIEALS